MFESAWYGGPPGKATWDTLFKTLHDFSESYVQAERSAAKPTGSGKGAPGLPRACLAPVETDVV